MMDKLVYEADYAPTEVVRVLTGSRGYGYATESSDFDVRTIHCLPTSEFLKTFPARGEDLSKRQKFYELPDGRELDVMSWELGKFLGMCANGNPNTLDVLFAEPATVLRMDDRVKEVFDNKEKFLSKKVIGTYMSFASHQKKDFDNFTDMNKKFKTALHYTRCMHVAYQLVSKGTFKTTVPVWLQEYAHDFRQGNMEVVDEVMDEGNALLEEINRVGEGALPETPDMKWIDEWLINFRLQNVGLKVSE